MKEMSKSQVTVIQSSSGVNEQNGHSDSLLGVPLLAGILLIALAAGVVLGLRRLCGWLNTREAVPNGGTEPTRPSSLT